MPNVRAVHYTIRLDTDKGRIVRSGTSLDELEDHLWELYDKDLLPPEFFAGEPDEDASEDDDDDLADLDDEIEQLDPPESKPASQKPED